MELYKHILKDKKYFILDMDGTFYLGDRLLNGSLEFIEHLKNTGRDFLFFTNNSSKNAKAYADKLAKMGCYVKEGKVVTSGMVTIDYLKKHYGDPRVYLLGTPMLEEDFLNSGIALVEDEPDVVVVGFDTTVTYKKLTVACDFIREGKPFIATHLDLNCPTEDGFIPDCGAICAFITASTGVKPKYIGKPFRETLDYIIDYLQCEPEEIVFTGDRLYTDIAIGYNYGVTSVLVLTGETKRDDLKNASVQPDIIVERLSDLIQLL
jgi:HAD superfamily hydrolase (TIGR01457 family)